ncbi:FAD-binding protein [candidate division KSB1 bacterium]
MSVDLIKTDVLVIGGGGAGFRAAIGAREKGMRALLVSKGPLARCGATPMAGADFTADGGTLHSLGMGGDPNDTVEKIFNDIVTQGFFLNNQKLLEQYVGNAPERLRELLEWKLKITGTAERAVYTNGLLLMDVLLRKARESGVEMLEDVMILDLVAVDGRVSGAVGLNVRSGEFVNLQARAVVIATGGWHKAFRPNTGMRDLSGEGIAMALRAGAEAGNLEFITFCCNVFLYPPVWAGSIAPYIIGLSCGGRLTNDRGEDFLDKYDPYVVEYGNHTEWNKCFVSYATAVEVRSGRGSPHGGVHFSRGDVPWSTIEAFAADFFPDWQYKSLDLTEFGRKLKEDEPVDVGAAVEYFDGGIVVNERYETSIEGLFAAGECALGPFGANRVFSAITEILVHGADAGRNAGVYAKKTESLRPDIRRIKALHQRAEKYLKRTGHYAAAAVRRNVQEMAHEKLGPVRNGKELNSFILFLDDIKTATLPFLAAGSKSRIYNKEWIDAIELENMVLLHEASARCALKRTESRGVHFREDFPETDNDRWLKEQIAAQNNGNIAIKERPVTYTSMTPPGGKTDYLNMFRTLMQMRSDIGGVH